MPHTAPTGQGGIRFRALGLAFEKMIARAMLHLRLSAQSTSDATTVCTQSTIREVSLLFVAALGPASAVPRRRPSLLLLLCDLRGDTAQKAGLKQQVVGPEMVLVDVRRPRLVRSGGRQAPLLGKSTRTVPL